MKRAKPMVLIVDDEEHVACALRRTLYGQGFELHLAASADEARTALEHRELRAVLSDVAMPGLGGLAFLGEVRERRPEVARILITGHREALRADMLAGLGLTAVLDKPWDAFELRALLRRACAAEATVAAEPWLNPT
jgi:DNA-binding NtrC family response regulator